MKITLNERVKHRLIGLAVILSIVAIFAPAIMKKSLRNFDDNLSISIELPPKPIAPKVAILKEEALFKTAKVAQVEIPPVPKINPTPVLAKAEPLSPVENPVSLPTIPVVAAATPSPQQKPATVAAIEVKKKSITQPAALELQQRLGKTNQHPSLLVKSAKNDYAIQLGTFSKLSNATALVKKLHEKGYKKAAYNKVIIQDKVYYKVIAGKTKGKAQAEILQKRLANAVQIKGIIVTTKVS